MSQHSQTLDLGRDPIQHCFKTFLMPAITGMVIKSLYIIADIMFIGHSMGEDGLAAINIVLPYFSLMFAIAMMVGVGGSTLMNIAFGEGDQKLGQRLFTQAFSMVTWVMLALTVVTLVWLEDIVVAFGAQGYLIPMAKDYVTALTFFAMPYAVGWVLSNFVRNDGNPKLVMNAMIASASMNVLLDWLFMMVFKWEMWGAGLATGMSQLALAGVLLLHFKNKHCRLKLSFALPDFAIITRILKNGLPTLFMEGSVGIVILISNWVLLSLGSTLYLSVYSVILNCFWLLGLLVYGVCQAVQPLISFNHGAKQPLRITETLNLGQAIIIAICLTFTGLSVFFPDTIVAGFVSNPSDEMLALGAIAMRLYGLAAIPMGINVLVMTIYQAIAKAQVSSIISILRSLVLPMAGLLLLPMVVNTPYVFANLLIADCLVLLGSAVLLRNYRRNLKTATAEAPSGIPAL